jgi:hypothetical protein
MRHLGQLLRLLACEELAALLAAQPYTGEFLPQIQHVGRSRISSHVMMICPCGRRVERAPSLAAGARTLAFTARLPVGCGSVWHDHCREEDTWRPHMPREDA